MTSDENLSKYDNLTFDDFRRLASDHSLSRHQKVGFPDSYREGKEHQIFEDMRSKVSNLSRRDKLIMEIGPGCSNLPRMLIELCGSNNSQIYFVDSSEMLALLPKTPFVKEFAGAFPHAFGEKIVELRGKFDAIIAYSVIQYVFAEGNLWDFIDQCLALLSDGGEAYLGDIPNISMRKRFFSSEAGYASHRQFTGQDELPEVKFNQIEFGHIDDSVILAILSRARSQGYHAWIMPQALNLPMANRREDILIRKP